MNNLECQIEAILFAAADSVPLQTLAQALNVPEPQTLSALHQLQATLNTRGIRLLESNNHYQLVTAPEVSSAVQDYLGNQSSKELSPPALEVLAVILRNQPAAKSQIDEIRGVASDQTIKNLLLRGLIEESGSSKKPGRPSLYSLTPKSLALLGVTHISELNPKPGHEAK